MRSKEISAKSNWILSCLMPSSTLVKNGILYCLGLERIAKMGNQGYHI